MLVYIIAGTFRRADEVAWIVREPGIHSVASTWHRIGSLSGLIPVDTLQALIELNECDVVLVDGTTPYDAIASRWIASLVGYALGSETHVVLASERDPVGILAAPEIERFATLEQAIAILDKAQAEIDDELDEEFALDDDEDYDDEDDDYDDDYDYDDDWD